MIHAPVMLNEVIEALQPAAGEIYIDGTFGAGGYTKAFLDAADCRVVAIDRDQSAKARATAMQAVYGDRLIFIQGNFGDVENILHGAGFKKIDGFVLDIGVSSMQIDEAARGFSFRFDGPLDMRMDVSSGVTAADIVNQAKENDLADIIYNFGEERKSRRVAKKIVERRKEKKFETTLDLADVIRACIPKKRHDDIDPATRTFQALRIAVNDELGELDRALNASMNILKPGGRLAVVSFHSLEDSRVKNFLREKSGAEAKASRHAPQTKNESVKIFDVPSRKAIKPGDDETSRNPRARSARMRWAVRTGNAAEDSA